MGPSVTRASLQADLLAAQQRCARMAARTQQLEKRLSELLGEQAWRATGLGAPTDIDQLQQHIVTLEQQVVDSRLQLEERDQDLAAARAANRELMAQLNASQPTGNRQTLAQHLLRTIFFSSQPCELRKRGDTTAAQATTPREPATLCPGLPIPADYAAACRHTHIPRSLHHQLHCNKWPRL